MVIIEKSKNLKKSSAILDENNLAEDKRTKKNAKQYRKSSITSLIPIVDVTNNDFFELKSGEYMEILQIESKDVYSLNAGDLANDTYNLSNFFAIIPELKIVPLNVPLNLENQKRYIYRKIKSNKVPQYKFFLEKRLEELQALEKSRTNREYFLFIYEESEHKLLQLVQQAKHLLSRSNPVIEMTLEKKKNILFQLNNPNTKPLHEK